jgi:hypothetical protein
MTAPNAGRHRITRKGFVSERDLNTHANELRNCELAAAWKQQAQVRDMDQVSEERVTRCVHACHHGGAGPQGQR